MRFRPWSLPKSRAASRPDSGRLRPQQVLVVCHGRDGHGLSIMENLCAGLEFAHVSFSVLDLGRAASWPDLSVFDAIVTCTEEMSRIGEEQAESIRNHVLGGGGLMAAYRCAPDSLRDVLGLAAVDGRHPFHVTHGLSFDGDLFPGIRGLAIGEEDWPFEHDRLALDRGDLAAGAVVLMSDGAGQPVAWRHRHGAGKVVFWNTGILFSRALRGLGVQSILDTMRVGVSAAGGFAMFHVDDFPPSIASIRPEPIASEFPELDWTSFAFDIWQHDIRQLAARHGISCTWYAVMDYNDVDNRAEADRPIWTAADGERVLAQRFARTGSDPLDDEYGFHGYNHDPLTAAAWPDLELLRVKLTQARALWQAGVPAPMPTSWVPANNWYHPEHVRILKGVFPEIAAVCGLFSMGDAALGEFREFGPEPWEPALLCLPRETYGYVRTPALAMLMLSQIAGMGVWTHFIHPDDVIDIPVDGTDASYCRNPDRRMWRSPNPDGKAGLLTELDRWLADVRSTFPWLDFLTTSQAVAAYQTHIRKDVSILVSKDAIRISSSALGHFFIRTDEGLAIESQDGCRVVSCMAGEGYRLHVVKCEKAVATLRIEA